MTDNFARHSELHINIPIILFHYTNTVQLDTTYVIM